MSPSDLEARLTRLDLQLDGGGEHLADERIAELCAGADATDHEAAHLAGCDDCVDLLMALGEGLEALAVDEPTLSALLAEPPRPAKPRGRRWTPLMIIGLAGAAAAAGWFAREAPPDPAPRQVVAPRTTAPEDDGPDEVPILPAEQVIGGRHGAGSDPDAPESPTEAPAVDPMAAPVAPAADGAPSMEPPRPAPPRAPPTRVRPGPRALERPPGLGTLERPTGPREVEHRPVDGPPRGFGLLQLNTRPPAQVYIDGKPYGWTPVIDLRLPEGPHDVRLIFESPLAAEPEQRFRVLIEPDRIWRMTRDNVKPGSR